jgi:hypothetical protein
MLRDGAPVLHIARRIRAREQAWLGRRRAPE